MSAVTLRDLLIRVDIEDPHEFATAYMNHVEDRRSARKTPMPVCVAVQRWVSFRSV